MARIHYREAVTETNPNETVLDALLREGHPIAHSCRSGVCHSCLMKSVDASPPPASQTGLRDTQILRNYFLACLCRPESDLVVEDLGAEETFSASVLSLDLVGTDVLRLRIAETSGFDFIPGQFATLLRPDGLARSYSIANLKGEGHLEFHIRRIPGGQMSQWLHDVVRIGDNLSIRGPSGACFYVPGRPDQPILLAGTGTGLAPLLGILRDALAKGHEAPIHLIHGGLTSDRIYLGDEIRSIGEPHTNFSYGPAVLNGPIGPGMVQGSADALALAWAKEHPGARVFLCGAPDFVNPLRKKLFLAGNPMKDILADAFVMATQPAGVSQPV